MIQLYADCSFNPNTFRCVSAIFDDKDRVFIISKRVELDNNTTGELFSVVNAVERIKDLIRLKKDTFFIVYNDHDGVMKDLNNMEVAPMRSQEYVSMFNNLVKTISSFPSNVKLEFRTMNRKHSKEIRLVDHLSHRHMKEEPVLKRFEETFSNFQFSNVVFE